VADATVTTSLQLAGVQEATRTDFEPEEFLLIEDLGENPYVAS